MSDEHDVGHLLVEALLRSRVFRASRDGSVVANTCCTECTEITTYVRKLLLGRLLVLRNLEIVRDQLLTERVRGLGRLLRQGQIRLPGVFIRLGSGDQLVVERHEQVAGNAVDAVA